MTPEQIIAWIKSNEATVEPVREDGKCVGWLCSTADMNFAWGKTLEEAVGNRVRIKEEKQ